MGVLGIMLGVMLGVMCEKVCPRRLSASAIFVCIYEGDSVCQCQCVCVCCWRCVEGPRGSSGSTGKNPERLGFHGMTITMCAEWVGSSKLKRHRFFLFGMISRMPPNSVGRNIPCVVFIVPRLHRSIEAAHRTGVKGWDQSTEFEDRTCAWRHAKDLKDAAGMRYAE